ncbi:MAG: hypothetical protein DRJ66_01965 [Thermoprotei archaeon]|nr:MAG: hypothetical protein DRJ66_01965 [Thermoprotei archaeon]RLF19212.1 MAG: hypothetical protein DRZ82_06555 [Thermoprotei archaeon]
MGLKDFLKSSERLFRLSRKPTNTEVWQILRITLIGTGILGAYGFLIMFLGTVLSGISIKLRLSSNVALYLLAVIVVLSIMIYAYGRRAGWWRS